jgi:DNA-binding NarL/FixJ family response regulator
MAPHGRCLYSWRPRDSKRQRAMEDRRTCWHCGRAFRFQADGANEDRTGRSLCPACCHPPPWTAERWRDRALTRRELQIVDGVRQGKINKQIAYELHLEEGTVKAYLHQIYRKLGVANRTAVAVHAAEEMLKDRAAPEAGRVLLSPRQRQLAAQVRQGKRNDEIAVEMRLSPNSVREYLSRLYKRLKTEGRTQLAVLATIQQWAPPEADPPEKPNSALARP